MSLLIRALTLDAQPLTRELVRRFDTHGGTIGRAEDSTLQLPDPLRYISRRQAAVHFDARAHVWMISNVGTANQILVNEHRLLPGEGVALADGDALQMGGYRLEVVIATDAPTVIVQRASPGFVLDTAPGPPLASHDRMRNGDVGVPADPLDLMRPNGARGESGALDRLLNGASNGDQALQRFLAPRDDAIVPRAPPAAEHPGPYRR